MAGDCARESRLPAMGGDSGNMLSGSSRDASFIILVCVLFTQFVRFPGDGVFD
jgi:hypothetical protein